MGLTSFEKFETPFGDVDVDTETVNNLLENKGNFFSFPKSSIESIIICSMMNNRSLAKA